MPRLGTGGNEIYVEPSTFSQYSSLAKKLCERYHFIGISLFIVTIAFSLCTKLNFQNLQIECSTPECISSRVSERMDLDVDPCSDFYSFACGGFIARNEIPYGKSVLSTSSEIDDKVGGQLRALLSETIRDNDPAFFNLVKEFHQQCMSSESYSIEQYRNIVARFDDWPVSIGSPWYLIVKIFDWLLSRDRGKNVSYQNWTKIIAEFRKVGYETNSIFSVSIIDDPKNRSSRIILIGPPSFGLSPKSLIQGVNNQNVADYFQTMLAVATLNGADPGRAEIELRRSLKFEMQLAQILELSNFEELLSAGIGKYCSYTLRDLQGNYSYIHWVEYINALLPSSVSVNEDEVVCGLGLSYFIALEAILKDTPPDVIKTYLIWRAIWEPLKVPIAENGGNNNCAKITARSLSTAVSSMYVRKNFNQTTREDVSKMVTAIRNELEFQLTESAWMDESTRAKSVEKVNEMFVNIGYPDGLMNDFQLEKFYNDSKIESNFLSSILSMNKFNTDRMFARLREPKRRGDFNSSSHETFTANAAYLILENGLHFSAAILQGNFFSSERPWYMNFGAIGSVIGHEFTHGYDRMERLPYSSEEFQTGHGFAKRERCLENQFGQFTEPMTGRKVNGMRTLRENIADNGGFKLSYLAYQKWEKENGVEPKLPGLNYTSQQMFWISAAQTHCSISNQRFMNIVMEDVHSPDRFRIIGSFRNSKEFAKDFQCPAGSPMNPIEKCEFW